MPILSMDLDEGKKDKLPDEYTLIMQFEDQSEFEYKVPLVKLQNMTVAELNEKNLIALLPFKLLKLRKKIENLRTEENLKELEDFTMRLYDQSLELPSDKYEKTVEELEEENKESIIKWPYYTFPHIVWLSIFVLLKTLYPTH